MAKGSKRRRTAKPAKARRTGKAEGAGDAFQRLDQAVETMQIGVTVTDLSGRIVYTNPADAVMHGYSVAELLGQDVRIFAAPGASRRMSPIQIEQIRTW